MQTSPRRCLPCALLCCREGRGRCASGSTYVRCKEPHLACSNHQGNINHGSLSRSYARALRVIAYSLLYQNKWPYLARNT